MSQIGPQVPCETTELSFTVKLSVSNSSKDNLVIFVENMTFDTNKQVYVLT